MISKVQAQNKWSLEGLRAELKVTDNDGNNIINSLSKENIAKAYLSNLLAN